MQNAFICKCSLEFIMAISPQEPPDDSKDYTCQLLHIIVINTQKTEH